MIKRAAMWRQRTAFLAALAFAWLPLEAWAAAPVGLPDESNVIFECHPKRDAIITSMMGNAGTPRSRQPVVWVTRMSSDTIPKGYAGYFIWWFPYADIQISGLYRTVGDFYFFGRGLRQLIVGPDGKAIYVVAQVDEAGHSVFDRHELDCRKGGGA